MKSFTELTECKIQEKECINLFATKLRQLMNVIKEQDKNFSEVYLNFQLLRYLTRKYDGIEQNILRWPEKEFKFDKIVLELVAEDTHLIVRDQDNANFLHQLIH